MSSSDARRQGGFTLVEVMVALVITGILATVLFQLVQGQGKFVQMESSREEVQQNSRGALELLSSELRTIPAGAIDTAAADRIRFRVPRAWGLVCASTGGGTSGVAIAFPAGSFPSDAPTSFASGAGSDWGLAIPSGTLGAYYALALTGIGTGGTSTCTSGIGLGTASPADVRQVSYSAPLVAPTAAAGSAVFLYQMVEYDMAQSSSSSPPGIWLRRRNGAGNMEPMAGPLLAADTATTSTGLSFSYYCGSSALGAAALAVRANWLSIDRIRIRVAMQSRNRIGKKGSTTPKQVQQDSITVHLRNTTGGVPCP